MTGTETNRMILICFGVWFTTIIILINKQAITLLNNLLFKRDITGFEKIKQIVNSEIFALNSTIVLNSTSQIISANLRVQKTFGWEENELLNRGMDKILLPEYIESFEIFKTRHEVREDEFLRAEAKTKSGEILWIEIFIGKWIEGVSTCYTIIIKDISHRIRNEQAQLALKEQVEALRELYHEGEKIGNIAFWHLDLLTGRIEWCSPNFYNIFGLPRGSIDIKVESIVNRVLAEDKVKVSETMNMARENKTGYDMEYRMHAWDGYVSTIHSVASAYKDNNGEVIYYIGIARLIKKEKPEWL
ncbi:MAG TPA: PAS domain-containing protein [Hanamia sp.]